MAHHEPKYQKIRDSLAEGITSGELAAGQKLPSEAMLGKRWGTSRITVVRAMRELQQLGLIERVAGSGSFVRAQESARRQLVFGLLIPDLGETEIFEPMCQGIASAPGSGHALLWGHADASEPSKSKRALALCRQYVERRVAGVFFAPLEFEADAGVINERIVSELAAAAIPLVLLDRRTSRSVGPGRPDLVGINNRQAGFVAAEHLIRLGCRRIGFFADRGAAATIHARYAGYQEALAAYGLDPVRGTEEVEGYVCLNDRVAGELMQSLHAQGKRIPEDVRIVGIDDVRYAALLGIPLTTVRQPCRTIGELALSAMLERLARPDLPAREILVDGELVVRQSCGARIP